MALYENVQAVPSEFWGAPVLVWDGPGQRFDGIQKGELYCPGYEGATYSKFINDYVLVAGEPTPGICTITGSKSRAIDKKKSAGSDGSRLTFHGIDNAEGELAITIWTPQQYQVIRALLSKWFPPSQKVTKVTKSTTQQAIENPNQSTAFTPFTVKTTVTKKTMLAEPQAFKVAHPRWKEINVTAVIFTGIACSVPGQVNGARTFTVKWTEYLNPGDVVTTKSMTKAVAKDSTLEPAANPPPGSNPGNTGP
jgi:hypothetical protein